MVLLQNRPRVLDIVPNNEQVRPRLVGVGHEITTYRPHTRLFALPPQRRTDESQQQQNFVSVNQAILQDQRHVVEGPLQQRNYAFEQRGDLSGQQQGRPQDYEQRAVLLQQQQQRLLELQRLLYQQQQQQQYLVQYQPLAYVPVQQQYDQYSQNRRLQEDQQIREQLSKSHNRFAHLGGYVPFTG